MEWLHHKPSDTSVSVPKNGIDLTWCTVCARWTNHTRANYKKKGAINQSTILASKSVVWQCYVVFALFSFLFIKH